MTPGDTERLEQGQWGFKVVFAPDSVEGKVQTLQVSKLLGGSTLREPQWQCAELGLALDKHSTRGEQERRASADME